MTMTKKELITLLREDAIYQRNELTPNLDVVIRINHVAVHSTRVVKLQFEKNHILLYYSHNDVKIAVAHINYDNIFSIGYKYDGAYSISERLYELREADFNAHCCKEA